MTMIIAEQMDLSGTHDSRSTSVLASVRAVQKFEGIGVELAFDHMCVMEMRLKPVYITAGDDFSMNDLVTVVFVLEGSFTVTDHRQKFRFTPGSAAFLSNRTSVTVQSTEQTRCACITFRRGVLDQHGVRLPSEFGSFAYSTAQFSPALQYVLDLIEVASTTSIQSEPVEANIAQLITDLFTEDREYYAAS